MTFWKKRSSAGNKGVVRKISMWPIGVGIGILFLIIGFGGDQFADMYRKAVMICLECIGIG